MKKFNIAILTGGNASERSISLKSADTIYNHLDADKYDKYIIELNGADFHEQRSRQVLDKNDFSFKQDGQRITFDLVFMMLHGHPAEDGSIQGYFDLLNIPYTGCDHFVSALTFNKQACKDFLRVHDIAMAGSVLLHKHTEIDQTALTDLGLPVFVKPNKNGSSYGASKVDQADQLASAIEQAFKYDDEVIVEQYLKGREFTNGVVRKGQEIIVLPITEVVTENDFFDYKAKYENQSQEITPARLDEIQAQNCKAISKKLYQVLGCRGVCRFDYIWVDGVFYFLEANTIPGMSEQSIIPQQTLAHGWQLNELLDAVVAEVFHNKNTIVQANH